MARRFLAALAVLAVLSAACGSSHKGAVKALKVQRTTTTTEATTTTLSPEQAVLAGYRASWDEYIAVGMAPDPADPRLAGHSTGANLAQIRKYFTDYRAQGLVQRGTVELAPRVVAVSGTTATVRDCILSHLQDVDAKTGQVRASDPQVRKLLEASMLLEGGVWKMSLNTPKGDGCTVA